MADSERRLRAERDLYRRLLDLHEATDLQGVLDESLGLVLESTGLTRGLIEVRGALRTRWFAARGFDSTAIEEIRTCTSTGIVGAALSCGETILTNSASLDPRFEHFRSVKRLQLDAVVCAPIRGGVVTGYVYLAGPEPPEDELDDCRRLAETFAARMEPVLDRLGDGRDGPQDPTAPWRERLDLSGLVGRSDALAKVFDGIALAAANMANVLITGETGTGKTRVARAIHDNGARPQGPFVALNCAALPDALFENELFGSLAGGHSSATRAVTGKVAAASGGTLFLDEVGELSLAAQSKLLSFLDSGEYYPLGASTLVRSDCRIIAATNRDLAEARSERQFRTDLYYRLHVLSIDVPSLAQRREDIGVLSRAFVASLSQRHHTRGLSLTLGAAVALENTDFPGNIRQLAHIIERGVLRADAERSDTVDVGHLFPEREPGDAETRSWQASLRRAKRRIVQAALLEADGNVTAAASRLELSRSQLYRLRETLGV